jgi:hypothetical protein
MINNIFGKTLYKGQCIASVDTDDPADRLLGWMPCRISLTDIDTIIIEVMHDMEWVFPYSYRTDSFDPSLPSDVAKKLFLESK